MKPARFLSIWAGLALFCLASWLLLAFVVATLARKAFG